MDGSIDGSIHALVETQWVMIFERHLKVEFDLPMMCCQEEGKEVHGEGGSRAVERATPRDTGLFCFPAPTATVYLSFLNI